MKIPNSGICIFVQSKYTVKPRYNALQGTEPGERYKRESRVSNDSKIPKYPKKVLNFQNDS